MLLRAEFDAACLGRPALACCTRFGLLIEPRLDIGTADDADDDDEDEEAAASTSSTKASSPEYLFDSMIGSTAATALSSSLPAFLFLFPPPLGEALAGDAGAGAGEPDGDRCVRFCRSFTGCIG